MEKGRHFSSIFDHYAEISGRKDIFRWADAPPGFKLNPNDLLIEGFLKEDDEAFPAYYVATADKLIACKENNKDTPTKALSLNFPTLTYLENDIGNGFSLTCCGHSHEFYAKSKDDAVTWYSKLKRFSFVVLRHISQFFKIGKMIGKGNYAKVHTGVKCDTNIQYAIKSLLKTKLKESTKILNGLINEIQILKSLDHPGIIKMYEVYESDEYVHLVVDYMQGGELFDKIQEKGNYSEADAATIMRKMLEAINYCQQRNIVHRDLKPENIMLIDAESDLNFKLIDFGLATTVKEHQLETLYCGSPGYIAPEVLKRVGYGKNVDIFSCGIVLYALLTGVSPFAAPTVEEILKLNNECHIDYPTELWTEVSPQAIELVKLMTETDPKKRISAQEALNHPWFAKKYTHLQRLDSTILHLKMLKNDPLFTFREKSQEEAGKKEEIITSESLLTNRLAKEEEPDISCFSSEISEYNLSSSTNLDDKTKDDICLEEYPTISVKPIKEPKTADHTGFIGVQSFTPGTNEERKIPLSPGASGVSKRKLADSAHLFGEALFYNARGTNTQRSIEKPTSHTNIQEKVSLDLIKRKSEGCFTGAIQNKLKMLIPVSWPTHSSIETDASDKTPKNEAFDATSLKNYLTREKKK